DSRARLPPSGGEAVAGRCRGRRPASPRPPRGGLGPPARVAPDGAETARRLGRPRHSPLPCREQPDSTHMADIRVLITAEEIAAALERMGRQISDDYRGKELLVVGVLKGAFMVMADLARQIDIPVEFDFMAVSSYGASTQTSGVVRILKDLDEEIQGRHVLIVEDIIDSGLTLNYLLKSLRVRKPESLEVAALLVKQGIQRVELDVRYVGFEIGPEFVVGYGLDYAGKYRNLPYVGVLESATV